MDIHIHCGNLQAIPSTVKQAAAFFDSSDRKIILLIKSHFFEDYGQIHYNFSSIPSCNMVHRQWTIYFLFYLT